MTSRRTPRRTAVAMLLIIGGCSGPAVKSDPLEVYQTPPKRTAREMDYWNNRTDLFKNPSVQPAQALTPPTLQRFQLKNKLSVLLIPDHRLPLVDVQLLIRTGAIDERPLPAGLAEFTAQMLRQGTRRMTADQISSAVDTAGAGLSIESDYEVTSIYCWVCSKSFVLCL